MSKKKSRKCVICGRDYVYPGNNAAPVADGICCDKCFNEKVLKKKKENETTI